MKGVVFLGNRQLEMMGFPDPTPGPDEVVLEIKASGMCGSDLHFYRASSSKDGGAQSLGLGGDGCVLRRRRLTVIPKLLVSSVGHYGLISNARHGDREV